jgi:phage FluMu protein Com
VSLQDLTLLCGACGKFLAVAEACRGQAVRCPHCRQMVQIPPPQAQVTPPGVAEQAPAASSPALPDSVANPSPAASGAPDVSSGGGVLSPPADIPTIAVAASADADHVLVTPEPWEAQLFHRDAAPVVEMPQAEMPQAAEPRGEAEGANTDANAAAAPVVAEPAAGTASPFTEGPHFSDGAPWYAEASTPVDAIPFAQEPSAVHDQAPFPAGPAERHTPAAAPRKRWFSAPTALAVLGPYAVVATVALAIALRSPKAKHPLEDLADRGMYEALDREFDEGGKERVDPHIPLEVPPLRLGEGARQIGDLEVKPLRVTRQKLTYSYFQGERDWISKDESLVLHLELKPLGLIFHPQDPTFNVSRAFRPGPCYTFLEISGRPYYGPIKDVYSERLKGQNFAELLPGNALETIVVATSSEKEHEKAVQALASLLEAGEKDQPLTWRVQLRKGRDKIATEQRGERTVWLTTVVPITFLPSQVEAAD